MPPPDDSAGSLHEHPPRQRPALTAWRRRHIARVLSFAALMQLPAGVALAAWLHRGAGLTAALAPWCALALLLLANSVLVRKLLHWQDDHKSSPLLVWFADVPYAIWASACFVGAPFAYLALAFAGASHALHLRCPPVPDLLAGVYLPALLLGTWGSTLGRLIPRVRRHEVAVEGLHPHLDGFRIVQLSDVHCGPYVPRWLYRYWAARANARRPDLLAVTGDLITAGVGYLDDVSDFVHRLRARDAVAVCLGNHDYFGTTHGVARAVLDGGARLLRNEGFLLARGDARLFIAGLDDRWTRRDDLDAALRDRPAGVASVLLAHDPASFPEAAARGVELTLSGHTHGGQFALPFAARRFNLASVSTRFTAGLFRIAQSQLYVHRGVGTSGPPTRIGVAPEIAVLTLRAGCGAGRTLP